MNYFKQQKKKKKNQKHKEIKEGLSGMNFKNYASRIIFQTNFDIFEKPPARCIEVNCSPGRDEKENIGKNKIFSIQRQEILLFQWNNFFTFISFLSKRACGIHTKDWPEN